MAKTGIRNHSNLFSATENNEDIHFLMHNSMIRYTFSFLNSFNSNDFCFFYIIVVVLTMFSSSLH